jgi:hypothetical protein
LTSELECQPCYSPWTTEILRDSQLWGESLKGLGLPDNSSFSRDTYWTCSQCDGGIRKHERVQNPNRECEFILLATNESEECSFPCKMADLLDSEAELPALLNELNKNLSFWEVNTGGFLQFLVASIFPDKKIEILLPQAQENTIIDPKSKMAIYTAKLNISAPDEKTFEQVRNITQKICSAIVGENVDLKVLKSNESKNQLRIETRHCPPDFYPSLTVRRNCDTCFQSGSRCY